MAKINEEKRAQWATLIQEQEASGLSQQAFCKERDLNFSNFSYYQNRLRNQEQPKSVGVWANDDKNIIRVGCHAHARRPFAELVKLSKNGLADEAVRFYRKLYAVEKEARENNLSPEQRHLLRKEKSTPILEAFKKWLDHHLVKTSEHGKIGKSIRYCLSNWNELTNYLKDGRIEIDNNLIENAIRPFALSPFRPFALSPFRAGQKKLAILGKPRGR